MSKPQLDPLRIVHAEFRAAAADLSQLPPAIGLELAFAGRSNVGKSSLMNALFARRNLVRTSGTPGCTRHIAFFDVRTADGAQLTLVDLPGYGFAKRSKAERKQWAELIEGYLFERPTLVAVAALVDLRRGLQSEDADLLSVLRAPRVARPSLNVMSVGTKLDKIAASSRLKVVAALKKQAGTDVCAVSVHDNRSCTALWRQLRTACGLSMDVSGAKALGDAKAEIDAQ